MAKKTPTGTSKKGPSGSAVAAVSAGGPADQAPPAGLAAAAGAPTIDAVDLTQPEEDLEAKKPDPEIKKLNDALRKEQDDAFKKKEELTRDNTKSLLEGSQQLSQLKQQGTPLFGTLR